MPKKTDFEPLSKDIAIAPVSNDKGEKGVALQLSDREMLVYARCVIEVLLTGKQFSEEVAPSFQSIHEVLCLAEKNPTSVSQMILTQQEADLFFRLFNELAQYTSTLPKEQQDAINNIHMAMYAKDVMESPQYRRAAA